MLYGGIIMPRVSLRVKRRITKTRGRNRAVRPKTFSSEESAKKWAEKKGLSSFTLENIKSEDGKTKKIRVVKKDD